jgi:hypothetical protein
MFHVMSEWVLFEAVLREALPMIESLKILREGDES